MIKCPVLFTYNPFHHPHSRLQPRCFSHQLPIHSLNNPHPPLIDPVLFQDMEELQFLYLITHWHLAPSPSLKEEYLTLREWALGFVQARLRFKTCLGYLGAVCLWASCSTSLFFCKMGIPFKIECTLETTHGKHWAGRLVTLRLNNSDSNINTISTLLHLYPPASPLVSSQLVPRDPISSGIPLLSWVRIFTMLSITGPHGLYYISFRFKQIMYFNMASFSKSPSTLSPPARRWWGAY